jgi:hypothetical protein
VMVRYGEWPRGVLKYQRADQVLNDRESLP